MSDSKVLDFLDSWLERINLGKERSAEEQAAEIASRNLEFVKASIASQYDPIQAESIMKMYDQGMYLPKTKAQLAEDPFDASAILNQSLPENWWENKGMFDFARKLKEMQRQNQ